MNANEEQKPGEGLESGYIDARIICLAMYQKEVKKVFLLPNSLHTRLTHNILNQKLSRACHIRACNELGSGTLVSNKRLQHLKILGKLRGRN